MSYDYEKLVAKGFVFETEILALIPSRRTCIIWCASSGHSIIIE